MELKYGTRVRFTVSALGAIATDGAYGSRMVGGLTYNAGELGELGHPLELNGLEEDSEGWYAVTPDRQPLEETAVYVPAHVSMFEAVV